MLCNRFITRDLICYICNIVESGVKYNNPLTLCYIKVSPYFSSPVTMFPLCDAKQKENCILMKNIDILPWDDNGTSLILHKKNWAGLS